MSKTNEQNLNWAKLVGLIYKHLFKMEKIWGVKNNTNYNTV